MTTDLVSRIITAAMRHRSEGELKMAFGSLMIGIRINPPVWVAGKRGPHRVVVKRYYADGKDFCGGFAKHASFPHAVRVAAETALDMRTVFELGC